METIKRIKIVEFTVLVDIFGHPKKLWFESMYRKLSNAKSRFSIICLRKIRACLFSETSLVRPWEGVWHAHFYLPLIADFFNKFYCIVLKWQSVQKKQEDYLDEETGLPFEEISVWFFIRNGSLKQQFCCSKQQRDVNPFWQ